MRPAVDYLWLTLFRIVDIRNRKCFNHDSDKMMRLGRVKPIISSQRFIPTNSADEIKIEKEIRQKIKQSLIAHQERIFKDFL